MTAGGTLTGAPLDKTLDWHTIDWRKVERNVRRLQARIVKAIQEGRWGKVKALQRLLTRSFSGQALAVKRVTENKGKRTPGVDGKIWDTPTKKGKGVKSLRQHGYRAQPLRRVYIRKSNGKKRPLGIPTIKDRAMQALYKLALDPIAETTGDPNSYGFRKARSAADAIEQCFICLSRKDSSRYILEGDIKGCFDNINHDWVLDNIPLEKPVLRQWLKSGFIESGVFYDTESGTPQGGIISPVIANKVLDGLEWILRKCYPKRYRYKGKPAKVHFIRYADDFIIVCSSRELLELEIKPLVEAFMAERGLELSAEKTKLTHIEDGFDFLGQVIRKYGQKLLTRPSLKSFKRITEKIQSSIKRFRSITAGKLIRVLNPMIRGWVNYHRHGASKETFKKLDDLIFSWIWRWARRRHDNKSAAWVKKRYYRADKKRSWNFFGTIDKKDGSKKTVYLIHAVDTPIVRHVKIKGEANPYDPEWETYFERRLDRKMAAKFDGHWQRLSLWREQDGRCPVCDQKITEDTGWHTHHLVWRSKGGRDTMDNLVLLHPNCHEQVHSRKLTVVKPRPVTKRASAKA